MTEIIFYGTPKRASTVQRKVRSTESYALVRTIKHAYSGIRFFRASSCNRRITNIISVVEQFGRKLLCSSGRIPTYTVANTARGLLNREKRTKIASRLTAPPLPFPHATGYSYYSCSYSYGGNIRGMTHIETDVADILMATLHDSYI